MQLQHPSTLYFDSKIYAKLLLAEIYLPLVNRIGYRDQLSVCITHKFARENHSSMHICYPHHPNNWGYYTG